MTCLTGADSRCYNKWSRILGVTTNDHGFSVLQQMITDAFSPFMIHNRVCNKSNTTDATVEQELPTHPEHLSSPPF